MKRKFYQGYDDGTIEFDPPVVGHPIVGHPQIDLADMLGADKFAALHTIDDEQLVHRYIRAHRECYEAERAIWDNSVPPKDQDDV